MEEQNPINIIVNLSKVNKLKILLVLLFIYLCNLLVTYNNFQFTCYFNSKTTFNFVSKLQTGD